MPGRVIGLYVYFFLICHMLPECCGISTSSGCRKLHRIAENVFDAHNCQGEDPEALRVLLVPRMLERNLVNAQSCQTISVLRRYLSPWSDIPALQRELQHYLPWTCRFSVISSDPQLLLATQL